LGAETAGRQAQGGSPDCQRSRVGSHRQMSFGQYIEYLHET
jgi:hypothetical protein